MPEFFNPQDVAFGTPNTGTTPVKPAEPGVAEGKSAYTVDQKATLPTEKFTPRNT